MKELTQVRDAVTAALDQAGIPAVTMFPEERVKQYSGAVAAVGVGAAEGKTVGFCNYLGEMYDNAAGTMRELYGKQLEADITVEVWAERASDCETGCQKTAEVLLGGLPIGIRPGELRWEAICWERTVEMFVRRGVLRCQAMFIAQTTEEAEVFLDFILRGVMTD